MNGSSIYPARSSTTHHFVHANLRRDELAQRRILENREVDVPAALVLFDTETLTEACDDVLGITTV
jgi:hypothetical protein